MPRPEQKSGTKEAIAARGPTRVSGTSPLLATHVRRTQDEKLNVLLDGGPVLRVIRVVGGCEERKRGQRQSEEMAPLRSFDATHAAATGSWSRRGSS